MSTLQKQLISLVMILIVLGSVSNALAGYIVSWGRTANGLVSDTPTGNDFVAIAGGGWLSHALKEDGSIVAWGGDSYDQISNAPTGNDFVAIEAGHYVSLALKADGSIVAWGWDSYGDISGLINDTPTESGFVAIAAGTVFNLALRGDGSLASWGGDYYGVVSNTPTESSFIAIAAGNCHALALKADGSIVAWGRDDRDQVSNTPTESGLVAIAAGQQHSLALKADGSIVSWGRDDDAVPLVSDTPTGNDFVAIAAGGYHSLALRADGSIVSWGYDIDDYDGTYGVVSDTPTGNNFVSIAGGIFHSLAIAQEVINSPPVANAGGPYLVSVDNSIVLNGSDSHDPDGDPLTYMWTQDGNLGIFTASTDENPTYTGTYAGITNLTLTVSDGQAHDTDTTILVVYDPDGGFVTGGGWIDSPAGAYIDDPTLEGKANFGFVSKYKKGATVPTGNTEFVFQAGNLNFHSSSYDWLVVTGSDYARFKGAGTINGSGDYKFMLWAGDNEPDTFRIRIWEEDENSGEETVIYDNGSDQAIGGGSIIVHDK
jgi:hypothetical protein